MNDDFNEIFRRWLISRSVQPPKQPQPLNKPLNLGEVPKLPPFAPITPEMVTRYAPPKQKVFVSYHHRNDQLWYNKFSKLFSGVYDLFTDTSIVREIDSDDAEYQSRLIREQHITGSSITIVLCGAETWKRKHVDWEIHATLEKEHALLGIALPTCLKGPTGLFIVPDRLHYNLQTGYARFMEWSEDARAVASGIFVATKAASPKLINNSLPQMGKNAP